MKVCQNFGSFTVRQPLFGSRQLMSNLLIKPQLHSLITDAARFQFVSPLNHKWKQTLHKFKHNNVQEGDFIGHTSMLRLEAYTQPNLEHYLVISSIRSQYFLQHHPSSF